MDHGLDAGLGRNVDRIRDEDAHINISDVIEVIQTDPDFKQTSMFSGGGEISPSGPGGSAASNSLAGSRRQAFVKILEQPASKALRFRYECEGRSAGSIPGASSTPENKTFPSIQVVGYQGRAVVVVSCVTKDPPYRPHPHNLVGREGCRRGVCTLEVSPETMSVTFSNLGIQCVKKKDIEDALKVREEIRVDPFRTGFSHRNQPTSIDLNAVRLCFQVFLEGDNRGKFTVPLNPIVSDPIYDKKAMSDLVICKLSDCSCTVAGGKEIILLCEKVAKEDIQVRFYEEKNGAIVWEGLGDFQPTHVHKQVAISFRTPRYRTLEVSDPIKVYIQLRRPSDGATSESLPFELLPLDSGRPAFWSLRRALHKKGDYNTFSSILAADARSLTLNKNFPRQKPRLNGTPALFQNQNKIEEETKTILETNLDTVDNGVQIVAEWKEKEPEVEPKQDWCDYTEVGNLNTEEKIENNNNTEEKSLNDLLDQVAELDEIYSDTQARLLMLNDTNTEDIPKLEPEPQPMEIETTNIIVDDTETYSSLQMAFKNPVEINMQYDIINVQGPIIDVCPLKRESNSEKLPPFPPKRIKKAPMGSPIVTTIGSTQSINISEAPPTFKSSNQSLAPSVKRSVSFNSVRPQSQELTAPIKKLPPTPCSTLPNPKKKSFFSKLFSKKNKKDVDTQSIASNISKDTPVIPIAQDVIHISLHPTPTGSVHNLEQDEIITAEDKTNGDINDNEEIINLDLTDAEHYALYTAMAPHATQSEFDELSCYYSPVEGGKVLGNKETTVQGSS